MTTKKRRCDECFFWSKGAFIKMDTAKVKHGLCGVITPFWADGESETRGDDGNGCEAYRVSE